MYYFIPPRHFHQIRMNSPIGNHPSQTFLSNQDAYRRRKTFCPQKAFWQSCAPEAHVSVSANKPRSQLPPISPRSQLPPESSCLSFANKPKPQFRQYPPQPQFLPASSASISALTASTIPESSRMRSLSMRLMGTDMENAYRDPPSSESAAAMQRTPASFSSLSSA